MTQTKAATVIAALVTAGYEAAAHQESDGSWTITSSAPAGFVVDVGVVATFVTNQAITGRVQSVKYS